MPWQYIGILIGLGAIAIFSQHALYSTRERLRKTKELLHELQDAFPSFSMCPKCDALLGVEKKEGLVITKNGSKMVVQGEVMTLCERCNELVWCATTLYERLVS